VADGSGGAGCALGLDQLGGLLQDGVPGCGLGDHHRDQPVRALRDLAAQPRVEGQRLARVGGGR